ncbi:MAG TPA: L,D-transpeptidase family protein [Solirubrobacteraceae bacterium]|jgi:lipoprotein-anchoring transpeptidase ErfK/SrfK|nr:L,D-transpeptidase family protein [Solirubrobacteraceae bacterium]
MPRTLIIIVTALVVLVLAGAGGVMAYDSGRSDVVASGVRIGTVDVGGLTAAQARRRVSQRLLEPLQEPVTITSAGRTFPLSAREAQIRANVGAMVDAAVRRSREGGVLARTWRGLTGGTVPARIEPQIAYSRKAVQRVVDRVRVAVSRDPVDAKVNFSADDVSISSSRAGRTIDARALRSRVEDALLSPTRERAVTAPIEVVEPKVTEEKLADRYPVVITINRSAFRLTLFKDLERTKTYPIAVGKVGLETPAGLYNIQNKAVDPAWSVPNSDWAGSLAGQVIPGGAPNNPLKARWLGVYDGVGVHGTDARSSIGTNASHGCIRMLIEDVKELYDQVPVGAPIFIG